MPRLSRATRDETPPAASTMSALPSLRDLSFGKQLVLYGSGLSLLSLVLAMAAILLYDAMEFRKAFVKRISERADILSRSCATALVFQDPASAERALADLNVKQDVTAACVYDGDGVVFAQFQQKGSAYAFPPLPASPMHAFGEGHLDVFRRIQFKAEAVGMLHIRANPYELRLRFQRYRSISLAVLLVSFLASVALAMWFKRALLRPIQALVEVAKRVSTTSDYAVRARKFTNDELGLLADSFNHMLMTVQQRETAARLSAKRYQQLFEHSTDGILILDAESGEVVDVNPCLINLLGYSHEVFLGKQLWEIGLFKDIAGSKEAFIDLQSKGYTRYDNLPLETAAGQRIDVEFTSNAYNVAGGKLVQCDIRDVSERKRAADALRESERKAKQLITKMMNAFALHELIYDDQGEPCDYRIIEVNPAWENIVGMKSEMVVGKTLKEVMPDIEDLWIERYNRIVETSIPEEFEEYRVATGKYFHCYAYCPEPGKLALFFTDTTENREAEDRLKASEKLLSRTSKLSKIGGWRLDLDTNNSTWTEETYNIFEVNFDREGHRLAEALDFYTPKSRSIISKAVELATRTGTPYDLELEIITAHGNHRWVQTMGEANRKNGQIVSISGTIQDITDKNVSEAALKRSEAQLRIITDNLPILISQLDRDLKYTFANQYYYDVGNSEASIIGKHALDVIGRETFDRALPHMQQALAGESVSYENRYQSDKRSKSIIFETHYIPYVVDGQVDSFFVLGVDITDRKQAEADLHTLNTELELRVLDRTSELKEANKELEAFTYSVSHDLRAPLRHLTGFSELLQKSVRADLDETSQRHLSYISGAALQMAQLIDDLLAFSRAGRAELRKAPVDLDGLVKEVIEVVEADTQGRQVRWEIAPLPCVSADPALLRLALTNLLSNAVKFTRPRDEATIQMGYTQDERERTFFIRDNGVGFDMQYVEKLFGVFQRLHTVAQFEGTGIGLANVRRIIQRHGGRTWAESVLDEGATFYFTLPLVGLGDQSETSNHAEKEHRKGCST